MFVDSINTGKNMTWLYVFVGNHYLFSSPL